MADDKEKVAAEAKLNEDLSKANSSEEIRDIMAAQPRDEHGKFTTKAAPVVTTMPIDPAKKEDEPTVYKDTFLIGGKPVEFTGDDPTDILKQVKAAQSAYEMAKAPEPKKDDVKPGPSKEELAALQLKAASGDAEAMSEYMVKSGVLDRYLESKGIKPAEIQQVLQERASDKVAKDWDGAVKEFLAESDWPGGTQNEKLLKYKLAELKDEQGQPLAYAPSKASLLKAYEALKEEKMLFAPEETKTDDTKPGTTPATPAATAATTTQQPPTATRPRTGSTAFGTSQEQNTRRAAPNAQKVPEVKDDDPPTEVMRKWKEAVLANGQSPDDVLRTTYAGRA